MEKTQLQNYHVHYGPAQGWSRVDLRELWRYKDLIWLFVKRDFNVMYKQTVLGPAWIDRHRRRLHARGRHSGQ